MVTVDAFTHYVALEQKCLYPKSLLQGTELIIDEIVIWYH